jgi:hypothetical protein
MQIRNDKNELERRSTDVQQASETVDREIRDIESKL